VCKHMSRLLPGCPDLSTSLQMSHARSSATHDDDGWRGLSPLGRVSRLHSRERRVSELRSVSQSVYIRYQAFLHFYVYVFTFYPVLPGGGRSPCGTVTGQVHASAVVDNADNTVRVVGRGGATAPSPCGRPWAGRTGEGNCPSEIVWERLECEACELTAADKRACTRLQATVPAPDRGRTGTWSLSVAGAKAVRVHNGARTTSHSQ
jgi:hypothetical protein